VSATAIETTATTIAPRARLRRIVSGTRNIPNSASENAVPLRTTARVAVLATLRIASRCGRPLAFSSRRRETMNSE
jgi:hypothetical protein